MFAVSGFIQHRHFHVPLGTLTLLPERQKLPQAMLLPVMVQALLTMMLSVKRSCSVCSL